MEAALLPEKGTDLVSTNGWDMAGHSKNWPISKPSSGLGGRMTVIGCQPSSCSRFVETKAVR